VSAGRLAALAVAALVLAAPAAASETRPTAAELESELVCPVCETTLDTSDAPIARRMKAFIRARIAAGDTKSEIKAKLVDQFGSTVLAVPPRKGFDWVAWILPFAGLAAGAAAVAVVAWRWSRVRREEDGPVEPRSFRMTATGILVAFGAGFVSFLAPCVLPLVPGYLSAVSSVEAERLGDRGAARRVVVSSLPFVAGLVAFFVLLGAGAAAIGLSITRNQFLLEQVAGFILIVFGLAFLGLLPWPERLVGAGLVQGARRRGSGFLLGGAFAVCAAPCITPVLGSILVLAGDSDTVWEGSLLLAVYALGLAVPFLIAAALFAPAMGLFRRLRDHYAAIQTISGLVLVALGALLFAGEFWRLRVYLNRLFEMLGLG
jgi:cytochrome c-type biogenesis protein